MYVRVWEYDVTPEHVDDFVTAYAADGDWAQLFERGSGFLGTELYRSTGTPTRFVTIDRWTDEQSWLAFLEEWRETYDELDARLAGLTTSQCAVLES